MSCSGVASGTALLGGGDQMNLMPQRYWWRLTLLPAPSHSVTVRSASSQVDSGREPFQWQ